MAKAANGYGGKKKNYSRHELKKLEEQLLSQKEILFNVILMSICGCIIAYYDNISNDNDNDGVLISIKVYNNKLYEITTKSILIIYIWKFVKIVIIGGYLGGSLLLTAIIQMYGCYLTLIHDVPFSPNNTKHASDELHAIVFPNSYQATLVKRRKSCEIDHLIYTCTNLDDGIKYIHKLTGIKPTYGGIHPNLGTHNALLSLGDFCYLEIIAPISTSTSSISSSKKDNNKTTKTTNIFGLNNVITSNHKIAAFAVHPNPHRDGSTIELHAQSMYFANKAMSNKNSSYSSYSAKIDIGSRKDQTQEGKILSWRYTSPYLANGYKPFIIDWGPTTKSPAITLQQQKQKQQSKQQQQRRYNDDDTTTKVITTTITKEGGEGEEVNGVNGVGGSTSDADAAAAAASTSNSSSSSCCCKLSKIIFITSEESIDNIKQYHRSIGLSGRIPLEYIQQQNQQKQRKKSSIVINNNNNNTTPPTTQSSTRIVAEIITPTKGRIILGGGRTIFSNSNDGGGNHDNGGTTTNSMDAINNIKNDDTKTTTRVIMRRNNNTKQQNNHLLPSSSSQQQQQQQQGQQRISRGYKEE